MNKCFILLGSNLGNRLEYLKEATQLLCKELTCIQSSSIYETAAWGNENQAPFFNQVIVFKTHKTAFELLDYCLSIEIQLGRIRKNKWAERTIDIDILYFNNDIIATKKLKVPHPHIQVRKFVLMPLNEVAPNDIHPIWNKTNLQLLECCNDPLEVKKIG
jgi:2-amino-4-hydroxy-6-hydroxymethyldihydropteridine diphosphokinase